MSMIHIKEVVPAAIQPTETLNPFIVEKLTKKELEIVELSVSTPKNPRIGDLDARKRVVLANSLLKEIRLRLSMKAEIDEGEDDIVTGMVKAISKHHGLTVTEIQTAVDKALDGEFLAPGQTSIFFTLANFSLWIKAYINDTKAPVMKKHGRYLSQIPDPQPKELTKEEQDRNFFELINQLISDRKRGLSILVTESTYNRLWELGLNKPTEEERERIKVAIRVENLRITDEQLKYRGKVRSVEMFIDELAEWEKELDPETGKIIDSQHYSE